MVQRVQLKTCHGLRTYLLAGGALLAPKELDGVTLEGMAVHLELSRTSLIKWGESLELRLDLQVLTMRL
jgi:hypothetical protein